MGSEFINSGWFWEDDFADALIEGVCKSEIPSCHYCGGPCIVPLQIKGGCEDCECRIEAELGIYPWEGENDA